MKKKVNDVLHRIYIGKGSECIVKFKDIPEGLLPDNRKRNIFRDDDIVH